MAADRKSLEQERERLTSIIKQWNDSRLDLFAISIPDENLEFNGVMRFYHKDSSRNGKYATKCIRVSSNSSTKDVIDMLSTKFRPDMRMLTEPKYVINEVHLDGEMRELKDKEKPLLVQLSWVKDDREGRFLLHNVEDKAPVRLMEQFVGPDNEDSSFKLTRNLTKKEKKMKKKQEKERAARKNSKDDGFDSRQQEIYTVKHLYSQVPESTFTRTVSNPEAVMKRKREQKLQKRGANILKVYGDRINPEIPYKSLLLLPTDNVTTTIRSALDKYALGKERIEDYNLIQVVLPPNSKPEELLNGGWGMETVLHDPKCPLEIEKNWQPHEGTLVFQLRHIDTQSKNVKASSPPSSISSLQNSEVKSASPQSINDSKNDETNSSNTSIGEPPMLLELSNSSNDVREHYLSTDVTEIGSNRRKARYKQFIEIPSNDILPSHCLVKNMNGRISLIPQSRCEVSVDGKPILESTMLSHGAIVRLGRGKDLVYCEPGGKVSMQQVRKKMQGFAQPHPNTQGDRRYPRGMKSQQQAFAESRQKSASLPKQLDDRQMYQNIPQLMHGKSTSTLGHIEPSQQQKKPRVLPATIQLRSGSEEAFLMEVNSVTGMNLHFKLSPAYAIYLSLRDIVEVTPKASLEPVLIEYLRTTTDLLDQTIQLHSRITNELAFWMANASELLNFVRHDVDVSPCTAEAQDALAKTVQLAFRYLVTCMQQELYQLMSAFLSTSDDDLPGGKGSNTRSRPGEQPNIFNVLHMLSSAMSLLRRCRVNAALTIQLFSQLFHFVNMWIFNEVVTKPEKGLCCRLWGIKLRARLARVEAWAEKQGLELAADCHLARVTQAMHLLQAPKQSEEDIANISGTCFKLNSLQLRALLSQYIPNERDGERRIPNELIDKVVQVARNTADELTRSDGRDVRLEEDPDLQLPFLLPEDGYSCDVVQSVPSGLTEFTRPLVAESICAYHINPEASGSWTVYFSGQEEEDSTAVQRSTPPSSLPPLVMDQPEMVNVTFNKHGGGLGLSIVAARAPQRPTLGIYVRAVVKGGAADRDGRVQAGDQIVSVDGHSLVGLPQEKAADILTKTNQIVTLTVAKKAALYHGLNALLEPSPETERAVNAAAQRRPASHHNQQPRPKSDGFALQQGYQPNQNPPYSKKDKRSQPPSNQRPLAQQNIRKEVINKSTTQLNESRDHRQQGYQGRKGNQAPRSAISMGNLQNARDEGPRSRAMSDWQKTWEAKMAHSTYQRNRAKSSSSAALTSPNNVENRQSATDQSTRRKQVENMFKHGHVSPRPQEQRLSPRNADTASKPRSPAQGQTATDNVNYEQLPPPPTPPPESPAASKSPQSLTSSTNSPREYGQPPSRNYQASNGNVANSPKSSHTLGRPMGGEKKSKETSKPAKNDVKSKSSTLPRHFKSASARDTDAQQRAIQEQLNALRDEEIDELSARIDSLTTLEKSRLNNLLKEREFQRRVEEESRRMYSDDDDSDEGYQVPDRPDRDRLIQMQDDHAEQFDAARDQEEELRKEEERERKKQIERERREEEEREKQLRERLDRERQMEEERIRREEEQRRHDEERRQYEEMQRREDEKRRREEAQRQQEEDRRIYEEKMKRREEERLRWEEERRQKERADRMREEEERRAQEEERLRKEQQLQDFQKRQWLAEAKEKQEREEREKAYQRQREEREMQREQQRLDREARDREIKDAQKSTDEDEKEEAERELLERQLSMGKPSNFRKFNRPAAYGAASVFTRHTSTSGSQPPPTAAKPIMRHNPTRAPRPASDGYFLGKTDHLDDEDSNDLQKTSQNSTSTYNVSSVNNSSPGSPPRKPVTYVTSSTTPRVIGAQERYRDPRDKREAQIKREQSLKRRQQEPSYLTFKDRQRLFSAGQNSPVDKPKASKKLLEIENTLKRGQFS